MKMPKSIREHTSNAEYYLSAANKHPTPTRNAVQILLLLIGWENIVIADEELNAWVRKEGVASAVYKSHARKLKDIPEVIKVIINSNGKGKKISFSSGRKFKKLRLMCQYGLNTGNKAVADLFKSGWHTDKLRNGLISKIGWLKVYITAVESMEKDRK